MMNKNEKEKKSICIHLWTQLNKNQYSREKRNDIQFHSPFHLDLGRNVVQSTEIVLVRDAVGVGEDSQKYWADPAKYFID